MMMASDNKTNIKHQIRTAGSWQLLINWPRYDDRNCSVIRNESSDISNP